MQSTDLTVHLPESMRLPVPEHVEGYREELLSWRRYEEVVGFLSLVVGDAGEVRAMGDEIDAVRRFDVTPFDGETCYVYAEMDVRAADRRLFGTFADRRLVVVPPVVYPDPGTVQFTVLGEPDALSGLLSAFPDEVTVDVERVSDHRRRAGVLAGRLTARQFEALEAARRLGYYDVPRTGSLSAVAAELDCTESAASTLLRTAEAGLVGAALGQ